MIIIQIIPMKHWLMFDIAFQHHFLQMSLFAWCDILVLSIYSLCDIIVTLQFFFYSPGFGEL